MKSGYEIIHDFVTGDEIRHIRNFWLERFKERPKVRVTWKPYLGQANTIGYSEDAFQTLYRACDFLWNEPFDAVTREVCTRAHGLRTTYTNEIVDTNFFCTASYYPPQIGRMNSHRDGLESGKPLIHVLVPITFKGIDYAEGGAVLFDREGRTVDIDSQMKPGDILIYDASLLHGVQTIIGAVGRMQIFPLPAVFKPRDRSLKTKYEKAKDMIRRHLGLVPNLR